jgi:hypothetical protein
MKKLICGTLLLAFSYISLQGTVAYDAVITFFILPNRESRRAERNASEKFNKMVQTPGKVSTTMLKSMYRPPNVGIFATYYGYLSISSMTGQISFPRSHRKTTFQLLITENIEPVMMIDNTVHHWQINEKIPALLYSLELITTLSPQENGYYWKVTPEPLPENKLIDANVITVLANPKYIEVKTGLIPMREEGSGTVKLYEGSSLFLPSIWVKKGIEHVRSTLSLLRTRQFFEPLQSETIQSSDKKYYQTIVTN